MADKKEYSPKTTVDWTSSTCYEQYHSWKREVERIMGGPYNDLDKDVQLNHAFIWAGAEAEKLVDAWKAEDPAANKVEDIAGLLKCLDLCLTQLLLLELKVL